MLASYLLTPARAGYLLLLSSPQCSTVHTRPLKPASFSTVVGQTEDRQLEMVDLKGIHQMLEESSFDISFTKNYTFNCNQLKQHINLSKS